MKDGVRVEMDQFDLVVV
jgi:hypothetical protein